MVLKIFLMFNILIFILRNLRECEIVFVLEVKNFCYKVILYEVYELRFILLYIVVI